MLLRNENENETKRKKIKIKPIPSKELGPKEQAGIQRKWKRKALSEESSRTGPKKRITKVVFFNC